MWLRTEQIAEIAGQDIHLQGGLSLSGWTLAAQLDGADAVVIGLVEGAVDVERVRTAVDAELRPLEGGCTGWSPNDEPALRALVHRAHPELPREGLTLFVMGLDYPRRTNPTA